MLMIRLARMGKRKQPFYRISVADKKNPPLGKQVEFIGHYDPKSKELKLDHERAKYWLGQGAGYSRTVGMMLVKEGLLEKEDLPAHFMLEKKRKKRKEQEEDKGGETKATGGDAAAGDDSKGDGVATEVKEEVKTEDKPKEEPQPEKKEEEKKEDKPEDKPAEAEVKEEKKEEKAEG